MLWGVTLAGTLGAIAAVTAVWQEEPSLAATADATERDGGRANATPTGSKALGRDAKATTAASKHAGARTRAGSRAYNDYSPEERARRAQRARKSGTRPGSAARDIEGHRAELEEKLRTVIETLKNPDLKDLKLGQSDEPTRPTQPPLQSQAEAEKRWEGEAPDADWTANTEGAVDSWLDIADAGEETLGEVDCRETLCKVTFENPNMDDLDRLQKELDAVDQRYFVDAEETENGVEITAYVARDGEEEEVLGPRDRTGAGSPPPDGKWPPDGPSSDDDEPQSDEP